MASDKDARPSEQEAPRIVVINDGRPSAGEDGDGQNDDRILCFNIVYGPAKRPRHWRSGIKIHTALYCRHYKEEIRSNDKNCPAYAPSRPFYRKVRPHKANNYQEHDKPVVSCSSCQHSVNDGYRLKKI